MLFFLCAQFFRSVQSTCTELLKVIEKYQHRINRESETAGHHGCGGASKERVHFFLSLMLSCQVCRRRRRSWGSSCAFKPSTIAQRPGKWWTPPARRSAPQQSRGYLTGCVEKRGRLWVSMTSHLVFVFAPAGWRSAPRCSACTRKWRRSGGAPSPTRCWPLPAWRSLAQSTEEPCSGWRTSLRSWTRTPTRSWRSSARQEEAGFVRAWRLLAGVAAGNNARPFCVVRSKPRSERPRASLTSWRTTCVKRWTCSGPVAATCCPTRSAPTRWDSAALLQPTWTQCIRVLGEPSS